MILSRESRVATDTFNQYPREIIFKPSQPGQLYFHKKTMFYKFILFMTFFRALTIVTSYNINTNEGTIVLNDPKSHERWRSSYFGFSTAFLVVPTNDRDFENSFVLVGAPRANVTEVPRVIEPGAVYKCSIDSGNCAEWNIDPTGNGGSFYHRDSRVNQIRNNGWIGATMAVESRTVVVCAPRWKNNIITGNLQNWFVNGMCYQTTVINDESTFDYPADNRFIPLLGYNRQITISDNVNVYNYGMGQTGFSLHMYSNNDNRSDIIIGNPGVYNWKGVPLLKKWNYDDPIIPSIGRESSILSADYFGYSVSSGFYMKKDERLYAAGAPRGADLYGRLLIFQFDVTTDKMMTVRRTIDGKQHGEYFGSSLASCDVDNDDIDEIVVGAPMWSRHMEEGRVYVYRYGLDGKFVASYLEGEITGGRFGTVITCLGDLDRDGYRDIAVGSPYENDNGAIYIYNGSPTGLSTSHSQRISGQTVSPGIRGFGSVISEPRDVDGNGYVDIAVGAYLSGRVVVLRSQPVAVVVVTVVRNGAEQLIQRNTTFFTIDVCSFYDGFNVPRTLRVERTLRLDPEQGRAFFGNHKSVNGEYKLSDTLYRGRKTCDELLINVERDADNVIEPMEIGVSLDLANGSTETTTGFCAHCPVVDALRSKLNDAMKLQYAVDCGSDNLCTSDLRITVMADDLHENRYTLGSKRTVRLIIRVDNHGEPAYNAQVEVLVPSPIFIGAIPPECTDDSRPDGFVRVTCQLGNPLRRVTTSLLELDMSDVRIGQSENAVVRVNVSTRSCDLDAATKMTNFTINYDVDADIAIAGKSQQDVYSYTNRDQLRSSDAIRFQHTYEVQKFGASPIEQSVLTITVPTRYKKNDVASVEIAIVNRTFGIMEGRIFDCDYSTRTNDATTIASTDYAIDAPPDDRTVYLNSTNPNVVECAVINCRLGIFADSLTVAKLIVFIDLQLQNLSPEIMETRDVVYFVTNGTVSVTQPVSRIRRHDDKSDSTLIATIFVGSPIASPVALWIIVASIFFGILLLVLLALGLVKLGFFRRNKREELDALKAQSDKNHGFTLETSSSMEVLDHD